MPEIPAEAAALFQVITVHCFFHCGHTARNTTPEAASDGMERHYSEEHGAEIRSILRKRIYEEPVTTSARKRKALR